MKKRIALLGSTGSIGQNTLEVIKRLPEEFEVTGLSTNANTDILYRQIKRFSPKIVAVRDKVAARVLEKKLSRKIRLLAGEDSAVTIAEDKRVDLVVLAISGSAALLPLLRAIESKKDVALANKEALVMAGNIVMRKASANKVRILPIDSEQSAIWQCAEGKERRNLKTVYLTGSGGPLRGLSQSEVRRISVEKVLRHPRWKMGKKISVDSATLMNKGLELIESMCLFGLDFRQIKVLIHPEAVIHSMVEFIDGSVLAQLSVTDMRIPIQYALTYPRRLSTGLASLDFLKLMRLSFHKPNLKNFPCLRLALEAAKAGGSLPCALNASNEIAVDAFLTKKINFLSIPKIIEKVLSRHRAILRPQLKDIFSVDAWARETAENLVGRPLGFANRRASGS